MLNKYNKENLKELLMGRRMSAMNRSLVGPSIVCGVIINGEDAKVEQYRNKICIVFEDAPFVTVLDQSDEAVDRFLNYKDSEFDNNPQPTAEEEKEHDIHLLEGEYKPVPAAAVMFKGKEISNEETDELMEIFQQYEDISGNKILEYDTDTKTVRVRITENIINSFSIDSIKSYIDEAYRGRGELTENARRVLEQNLGHKVEEADNYSELKPEEVISIYIAEFISLQKEQGTPIESEDTDIMAADVVSIYNHFKN